jgi:hypothetical protein
MNQMIGQVSEERFKQMTSEEQQNYYQYWMKVSNTGDHN